MPLQGCCSALLQHGTAATPMGQPAPMVCAMQQALGMHDGSSGLACMAARPCEACRCRHEAVQAAQQFSLCLANLLKTEGRLTGAVAPAGVMHAQTCRYMTLRCRCSGRMSRREALLNTQRLSGKTQSCGQCPLVCRLVSASLTLASGSARGRSIPAVFACVAAPMRHQQVAQGAGPACLAM